MALRAINPDAVRQYVSRRDSARAPQAEGTATVFSLRTLSAGELAEVMDATQELSTRGDGSRFIRVDIHQRNLRLVQAALAGWHNFEDERGNALRFELASDSHHPHVAERSLGALPPWLVRELAHEVMRDSMLSADDAKNSGASFGVK